MKSYLLAVLLFAISLESRSQEHQLMGRETANKELKIALENKTSPNTVKKVLLDKTTAISIAEIYLFKVYGQKQIVLERPYEVYLINGYWVIMGTLPKGWDGGCFTIILSAVDGRVIRLTHYR